MLVIHADEIEAAHGATVGQIDQAALFYLRSRGLPAAEARQMLTTAFCREPIDVIGEESVRTLILAYLDKRLANLESE